MNRWFSIRNILLAMNIVMISLPLGILYILKLYDNELIRRTESELIMQAAFIEAAFKVEALKTGGTYGRVVHLKRETGEYYKPVLPKIDLSGTEVLPSRPDAEAPTIPPDPRVLGIGKLLNPVLMEAQRRTLAGIRVLDFNGVVIAGRDELGLSLSHIEEVRAALGGSYESALRKRITGTPDPPLSSISRSSLTRVFIAYPIVLDEKLVGVAYLSRTPENLAENIYTNRDKLVTAGLVILLLTIVTGFAASYAITRPLSSLVVQAKKLMLKEKVPPLKKPVTTEVRLLSESILKMARTVENRSDYIRNFATHVSHEFKGPIASIQGTVELLAEHMDDMRSDEKKKFLDMVKNDSDRLRLLVERLLDLARADMFEPSSNESSDIGLAVARLRSLYRASRLRIDLESEAGRGDVVPLEEEALNTILKNLIDNSVQNGAEKVSVSVTNEENRTVIRVRDNGNGISEANLGKVCTPFFTTNRKKGGTGLGLSIVKALVDAYKGEIKIESKMNESTEFTLIFPDRNGFKA